MTHYEVLGIDPGADAVAVRRAYLGLARRHHPDTTEGRTAAERAESEAVIRRVNAAWKVLSDPVSRARYDEELGLGGRPGLHLDPPERRPFVPIHAEDEDDDDAWRYEDDVGDPRTAPPRSVVLVPVGFLGASAVSFGAWLWTAADPFLAVSVMAGAVSVVGFVVAPIVAMSRASRFERR